MSQAINDRDITCQMPQECPEDSGVNLAQIASAIEHSKLSSEINRRIAELKQGQTGLQELSTPSPTSLNNLMHGGTNFLTS